MPKVKEWAPSGFVCVRACVRVWVQVCDRGRQYFTLLPTGHNTSKNSNIDNLVAAGAADAACSVWFSADRQSLSTLFHRWPFITKELLCTCVPDPFSAETIDFPVFTAASPFPKSMLLNCFFTTKMSGGNQRSMKGREWSESSQVGLCQMRLFRSNSDVLEAHRSAGQEGGHGATRHTVQCSIFMLVLWRSKKCSVWNDHVKGEEANSIIDPPKIY